MNTTYALNKAARQMYLTDQIYFGFSTTEPTADGTSTTEPIVAGNGYARTLLDNLSDPTAGVVTNTKDIVTPRFLVDSGIATHGVIFDAETDGNLLHYFPLDAKRHLEPNSQITIETGELKLTVVNPTTEE